MIARELLTAFVLGLVGGLIPGPVITAVFTQILHSGLRHAFRIILLALVIETIVAVVSLVIFSSLGLDESVFRMLSFIGAGVLIWISITLWKVRSLDTDQKVFFSKGKITAMILTNGVLWTYWITICVPRAVIFAKSLFLGDYLFLILVQTGWLVSTTILAYLFSRFRKLLSRPAIVPVAFKIFSIVFLYFAADMIYQSILFFNGK
ncbi:MAG: hypothetical protein K9J30_13555 [Bacteroidales bacterium]|nr:hypothetical protein [Bacteroidales bacterium]